MVFGMRSPTNTLCRYGILVVVVLFCNSVGCSTKNDQVCRARRALESDLKQWTQNREQFDPASLAMLDNAVRMLDGKKDVDFEYRQYIVLRGFLTNVAMTRILRGSTWSGSRMVGNREE